MEIDMAGAALNEASEITQADITKVHEYLKRRANTGTGKTVPFGDIRQLLGKEVARSQWHLLLNPIYQEEKIKRGMADLSCIVVDKDGNPPYFSDGGPAQSVRFDPKKHMAKWSRRLLWFSRPNGDADQGSITATLLLATLAGWWLPTPSPSCWRATRPRLRGISGGALP